MPSQGTSCETNFGHGSLLLIRPSTITPHAKFITMEQQGGLSRAAHSRNGRRMGLCYGSAAVVCFSRPDNLYAY